MRSLPTDIVFWDAVCFSGEDVCAVELKTMLGSGSKVVKIDGSPLSEEALAANDAVVRAQQEPDPEVWSVD